MAKKKRGMPSKTCINPKCGATIHARKVTCPKCGTEQPKSEAKAQPAAAKARKPAKAKRGRPAGRKPAKAAPGGLPEAISFIRQVGGLGQAMELLNQIDEIKKL